MEARIQVNCLIEEIRVESYPGGNDRIYQPAIWQEENLGNKNYGEDDGLQAAEEFIVLFERIWDEMIRWS